MENNSKLKGGCHCGESNRLRLLLRDAQAKTHSLEKVVDAVRYWQQGVPDGIEALMEALAEYDAHTKTEKV